MPSMFLRIRTKQKANRMKRLFQASIYISQLHNDQVSTHATHKSEFEANNFPFNVSTNEMFFEGKCSNKWMYERIRYSARALETTFESTIHCLWFQWSWNPTFKYKMISDNILLVRWYVVWALYLKMYSYYS